MSTLKFDLLKRKFDANFIPRDYQQPIMDALEKKKFKRLLCVLPRRAGKDVVAFNLMVREAMRSVGSYFYIFPTYSQARKVIFDALLSDGRRFIDFILPELVESVNSSEMKIRLHNQSVIQLLGSDNYDSLVGTNPRGIVFSEYALTDPRAYQYLRPALTYNNGWALFISTPRGKNHLYELWQIAQHNPSDWYSLMLTVEQTNHIPLEEIEKERQSGELSDDMILQEYYCSFDMGVEGAYYAKYFDKLRLNSQIGQVPWEPAFKVHTAWDIGMRDSTTIIFFQIIGQTIKIIDCYEKSKEGIEHYVKVIESKPYSYGKHIGPHDIRVREFGSGITRWEKARQLGVTFTVANDLGITDGIEAVRTTLPKCWFDEAKCASLIKALENYRQEYDAKRKIYKTHPLHDVHSHFADAMRYLCVSLPKTRDGLTPEGLDKRYQEAVYGTSNANMPSIFRDDLPRY